MRTYSRRGPDIVAEELATVLSKKGWFEFKALFDLVYTNLKARNAAGSGGEDMLRLRAYEKLQNLVFVGAVEKSSKRYRGIASGITSFFEAAALVNARFGPGMPKQLPYGSPLAA